ncbi:MAG: RNA 2',3'-cyclic phosphodiesterase [Nanoarchaeota archaeon]|nr:RNA 2',3'-cyclic phosphodiesterase [Nanoarchaeota archaeon]
MRSFVALDIPEGLITKLKYIQDALRGHGQFSFPKSFHLTLSYLGEIEDAERIIEGLSQIRFDPFKFKLDKVGMFGKRVIWIGIKPEQDVVELAKQVRKAAPPKDSKFHPHITLARIKWLKDQDWKVTIPEDEVLVEAFKLYKSTLTPEGAVYEVLGSFTHGK